MSEVRAAAGRSYPESEASGGQEEHPASEASCSWKDPPHVRGQGPLGEAASCLRPGAVTLRRHPEPKARDGSWEEPPTPEIKAGGREKQPEEQWLSRHRRA